MHYNCLIVDDEEALAQATCEYFNLFEVRTIYVTNAEDCMKVLKTHTVDVMLLDINLKQSSGFELCKKIRKEYQIPILFISARTSDDDVIIALNIGGDDYVKKPYSLSILLAKVKIMLKRYCANNIETKEDFYDDGYLKIDFTKGMVFINEQAISLKAMEYKLLTYLVKNKGRVIPKDELFENVWEDCITGDGTLNVHIRYLREKIELNPNDPVYIKTVWGRGYQFNDLSIRKKI